MFGAFFGGLGLAIGMVLAKDVVNGAIKTERELKALLPASVSFLGSIPSIETNGDRRQKRRRYAYAIAASVVGCLVVAVILWKVHPIL
jgi:hypothetical protein